MSNSVKFPEIEVQLSEEDGNGFMIIVRAGKALSQGGVDSETIENFRAEAMAGDYDHLLRTVNRWVTVL